jgi:hypothetical protein
MELLYGTWGRRDRKENDKASTISKSMQVEDITIRIESY